MLWGSGCAQLAGTSAFVPCRHAKRPCDAGQALVACAHGAFALSLAWQASLLRCTFARAAHGLPRLAGMRRTCLRSGSTHALGGCTESSCAPTAVDGRGRRSNPPTCSCGPACVPMPRWRVRARHAALAVSVQRAARGVASCMLSIVHSPLAANDDTTAVVPMGRCLLPLACASRVPRVCPRLASSSPAPALSSC